MFYYICWPLWGQGKPTTRISANVNGLSAFHCLMALRGSTKMTLRRSGKRNVAETWAVGLPEPAIMS